MRNTFHKDKMLNYKSVDKYIVNIFKREVTPANFLDLSNLSVILESDDGFTNAHSKEFNGDTDMYFPLKSDDPAISLLPVKNEFEESSSYELDRLREDTIHKVIPMEDSSGISTTLSNRVNLPDPAKYPKDRGRMDFIVLDGTDQLNFELSPVVSC